MSPEVAWKVGKAADTSKRKRTLRTSIPGTLSQFHSFATPLLSVRIAGRRTCMLDLATQACGTLVVLVVFWDKLPYLYLDLLEHSFINMLGSFLRFGDSVAKHVTGNKIPPAILTS